MATSPTVTPNAHRYARGRRDRDSGPKQYDTALDQIVERLGVSGDRYDAAGMHAVGRRGKEDGSGVIALRASTPASASEV